MNPIYLHRARHAMRRSNVRTIDVGQRQVCEGRHPNGCVRRLKPAMRALQASGRWKNNAAAEQQPHLESNESGRDSETASDPFKLRVRGIRWRSDSGCGSGVIVVRATCTVRQRRANVGRRRRAPACPARRRGHADARTPWDRRRSLTAAARRCRARRRRGEAAGPPCPTPQPHRAEVTQSCVTSAAIGRNGQMRRRLPATAW